MTMQELDIYLKDYTEVELRNKSYYDMNLNMDYSEDMDINYIGDERVLIHEKNTFDNTIILTEYNFFKSKKNNNVVTERNSRYAPIFKHKHTFFELIYDYSGCINQEINGNKVHLNKGDICIIPPDVEHTVNVFDDSIATNILIRKSTFNETFLKVFSDENILSLFFIKFLYTNTYFSYIIFRNKDNPKINEIISDIIIEDVENKKYANKILDNLIMTLFAYLLRDNEDKVELPLELQKNTHQLDSILIYIQDNFETTNLNEMSDIFHFTVPYLSKIIKLNTGENFKDIIQTLKLNRAVGLLKRSNLKICRISEAIGYENNTHFIRTFKKVYGVSPNQYRKSNKIE